MPDTEITPSQQKLTGAQSDDVNINNKKSNEYNLEKYIVIFTVFYIWTFGILNKLNISVPVITSDIGTNDGGGGTGLFIGLLWILTLIIFLASMLFAVTTIKKKNNEVYYFYCGSLFVFQLICYLKLMKYFSSAVTMITPFFFLPLFYSFLLLINRLRYRFISITLFLSFPLFIIINDKIEEHKYIEYLKNNFPQDEIKPLYLPLEYFHKEGIKWVPNYQDVRNSNKDILLKKDLDKYKIYRNISCSEINEDIKKSIKDNDYIVVCTDYAKYHKMEEWPLYESFKDKIVNYENFHTGYKYIFRQAYITSKFMKNLRFRYYEKYEYGDIIKPIGDTK